MSEPETYRNALAAWLRGLAGAVEDQAVDAGDIAQALFREDAYTVTCPLSETQSTRCDRLIEQADKLYPAPAPGPRACLRCRLDGAPGALTQTWVHGIEHVACAKAGIGGP